MDLDITSAPLSALETEALVVGVFEKEGVSGAFGKEVDGLLTGALSRIADLAHLKGKEGEFYCAPAPEGAGKCARIALVGLGKPDKWNPEALRKASGIASSRLQQMGVTAATTGLHLEGRALARPDAARAVTEGSLLGAYQFTPYKTEAPEEIRHLARMSLYMPPGEGTGPCEEGIRTGSAIARAQCFARDLGNHPGNVATPLLLAERALEMGRKYGLSVTVLNQGELEQLGMRSFLSVAKGSEEPPRLLILEHTPKPESAERLVFIGKGITFDSGGISIKPAAKMEEMKMDMSGAAAVLGALCAIAELKVPVNVVGLAPACENLPSGRSNKPGDVVAAMSGRTIEIINTDAEGRLILADALTYAERYSPAAVIDLATLTGACVVALGGEFSGLMSTNRALAARVKEAAERSGEAVWELPCTPGYDQQLKSVVADVKNVGGREGGAVTAARFLAKFAEKFPWAHLDIAGTAWVEKGQAYKPEGSTGIGVRLLTQFALDAVREGLAFARD